MGDEFRPAEDKMAAGLGGDPKARDRSDALCKPSSVRVAVSNILSLHAL